LLFGAGVPKIKDGASTKPTLDAAEKVMLVKAALLSGWDAHDEKKGWPGSTS
jgi:uncharacterized protein YcnI